MTVRAAPFELSTLLSKVKYEVGDLSGDYPRYGETQILLAVADQLVDMSNEALARDKSADVLTVDMTYSGSATELPEEVGHESVLRVDNIEDAVIPVPLQYVSPHTATEHQITIGRSTPFRYRYTLMGPADVAENARPRIVLFPKPSGSVDLRVWYIAGPMAIEAESMDPNPQSSRFNEVVVLGAALKLMRREGQATAQQLEAYARLWRSFQALCRRPSGKKRISRTRRGIS